MKEITESYKEEKCFFKLSLGSGIEITTKEHEQGRRQEQEQEQEQERKQEKKGVRAGVGEVGGAVYGTV